MFCTCLIYIKMFHEQNGTGILRKTTWEKILYGTKFIEHCHVKKKNIVHFTVHPFFYVYNIKSV